MTDIILELIDACEIVVSESETVYMPIRGYSDAYIHEMLDISQGGVYHFHRALQRFGKPQMKGDA